jgi:hypothetical protein
MTVNFKDMLAYTIKISVLRSPPLPSPPFYSPHLSSPPLRSPPFFFSADIALLQIEKLKKKYL